MQPEIVERKSWCRHVVLRPTQNTKMRPKIWTQSTKPRNHPWYGLRLCKERAGVVPTPNQNTKPRYRLRLWRERASVVLTPNWILLPSVSSVWPDLLLSAASQSGLEEIGKAFFSFLIGSNSSTWMSLTFANSSKSAQLCKCICRCPFVSQWKCPTLWALLYILT